MPNSTNSLNISLLEGDLKRDEGRRDKPYKDSRGFSTIGYGHNLDAEGLCEEALAAQLAYDIRTKALEPLYRTLPWAKDHPEKVQRVLANLTFNMGPEKLSQFKATLELIRLGRYPQAADQLMRTLYAKQVGQRASRLASLLRSVV